MRIFPFHACTTHMVLGAQTNWSNVSPSSLARSRSNLNSEQVVTATLFDQLGFCKIHVSKHQTLNIVVLAGTKFHQVGKDVLGYMKYEPIFRRHEDCCGLVSLCWAWRNCLNWFKVHKTETGNVIFEYYLHLWVLQPQCLVFADVDFAKTKQAKQSRCNDLLGVQISTKSAQWARRYVRSNSLCTEGRYRAYA